MVENNVLDADTLAARRAAELINPDPPGAERLFAVVSWGAAGTHWLSRTLNDCPGVYCAHASNLLWTRFAGAQILDGADYLRLIAVLGAGNQAAGDVHGISRHDVPVIREALGDRFRAIVLVRDPLHRLVSQLALFSRYAHDQYWDVGYLSDKFPHIQRLLPTGAYEEWLFVHGANMLNAIVDEVRVSRVVRMEDLTTDPASLVELVSYLTDNTVKASEAWAHTAIALGATNRHAIAERHLLDWQRRALVEVIDKAALECYRGLGYELDANPMMWELPQNTPARRSAPISNDSG